MSFGNWAVRSALAWLLAAGALVAATETRFAVTVRDRDWVPGPLSGAADLVSDAFLWIHLGAGLLVLLPAYWWGRRGGSGIATACLAFSGPLSLVALLALWRGTQGWDGLYLMVVGGAGFALSFVAAVLIGAMVRPAGDEP